MKALKLIGFGALLALFILFAFNNWVRVPIDLPDGSKVLVFLPIIVLVSVLLGWLPMLLVHVASRSSWRRRTARVERLLDEAQAAGPRVAPSVAETAITPMPSSFSPLA
jgi:putative membrane protein